MQPIHILRPSQQFAYCVIRVCYVPMRIVNDYPIGNGLHHIFALVHLFATAIENRYVAGQARERLLLRFQLAPSLLGTAMEELSMVLLTMPVFFPVIVHLGFDPIWFGVIIVMTVELGLIHPPVGMIVFVIKSVVQDVSFATIFKGVLPFIATDLIRLVILIAFPIIALWLPSHM